MRLASLDRVERGPRPRTPVPGGGGLAREPPEPPIAMSTDTLKVADLMQRDAITLDVDMSLREAVEVLRGAGIGGAPVLQGRRLVGVLSGTDVLEFVATSPGVPPERPDMLPEFGEMEDQIPEEEEPEHSDVVSDYFFQRWENSEADVWSRIAGTDTPEWDQLEQHTVEEIMSPEVVTVPSAASVADAARKMVRHEIHRLLVVDGEDLTGVLSAFDLVRLVAERGI